MYSKVWINNDWTKRDGTPVLNADLFRRILSLKDIIVSWNYVKAHDVDELNNLADELAKAGAGHVKDAPRHHNLNMIPLGSKHVEPIAAKRLRHNKY